MTLATHAIVGAAITATLQSHPILGGVLAFGSHFLIDALPHWDYKILSTSANPNTPSKLTFDRLFILDLIRIGGDAFLGLVLSAFFFFTWAQPELFLVGSISAILPDFLQFVYSKYPKGPVAWLQRFHVWIHTKHRLNDRPLFGVASQVLLVLAVLFFVPHTFSPFVSANNGIEVGNRVQEGVVPALKPTILPPLRPPQFVLLAFDGSRSKEMWEETRAFARGMLASSTPVHFTYFVSGTYFLKPDDAYSYQAPGHLPGESPIGFAYGPRDLASRIEQVRMAESEGHEIGSHAVGHFNGALWSEADWLSELRQFSRIMTGVTTRPIIGFRAPELAINAHLYTALKEIGYRYDTSRVAMSTDWPKREPVGIWQFPLASIHLGTHHRATISMDYSLYHMQTGVKDTAYRGTPLWNTLYADLRTSYRDYFTRNYEGNRAPVYIGNHFSKWNDGLYWQAMQDFAREVCVKPEVKCVTFSELADFMDTLSPEVLARYQTGAFPGLKNTVQ